MRNNILYMSLKEYSEAALQLAHLGNNLAIEHALQQTDLYNRVVNAIEQDEVIARHLNTLVGTAWMSIRIETIGLIRLFLALVLRQIPVKSLQEVTIDHLCQNFEDFFYKNTLPYRCFAPISGLKMEAEKLEISSELSIVKITEAERNGLISPPSASPFVQMASASQVFAFEFFKELHKIIGRTDPAIPQEHPLEAIKYIFSEICKVFRLFKKGSLGFNHLWVQNLLLPIEGISSTFDHAEAIRLYDSYTLTNEDVPEFLALYDRIKRTSPKHVEAALRRFNFGCERRNSEDQLIDFMIAFEAILLGDQQELKYKLALRGSALLGKTPAEKRLIFDELRTAYDQRSKIVHGNKPDAQVKVGEEKIPFAELVNRVEELLRSAIKQYPYESRLEETIKILDDRIVKGSE